MSLNLTVGIDVMLRDFGVPVVAGARTVRGIVDSFDEQILATGGPANMAGRQIVLLARTADLPIPIGSALTIDGQPHVLREKYQLADGVMTNFICSKGSA